MKQINAGQRILAAVASIAITAGVAQGMAELSRHEAAGRGITRGAAAQAGIACAPGGGALDLHGTRSAPAARAKG